MKRIDPHELELTNIESLLLLRQEHQDPVVVATNLARLFNAYLSLVLDEETCTIQYQKSLLTHLSKERLLAIRSDIRSKIPHTLWTSFGPRIASLNYFLEKNAFGNQSIEMHVFLKNLYDPTQRFIKYLDEQRLANINVQVYH